MLLRNHAIVDARNIEGSTPLHDAVAKGNAGVVQVLLNHSANIYARNVWNHTALFYTSSAAIIKLLNNFLKPNPARTLSDLSADSRSKNQAADSNSFDVAKSNNAATHESSNNINLLKSGKAAIHRAVENNSIDEVISVIKLGADINLRDSYSRTALYIAVFRNYEQLVAKLLEAGVHTEIPDRAHNPPSR